MLTRAYEELVVNTFTIDVIQEYCIAFSRVFYDARGMPLSFSLISRTGKLSTELGITPTYSGEYQRARKTANLAILLVDNEQRCLFHQRPREKYRVTIPLLALGAGHLPDPGPSETPQSVLFKFTGCLSFLNLDLLDNKWEGSICCVIVSGMEPSLV